MVYIILMNKIIAWHVFYITFLIGMMAIEFGEVEYSNTGNSKLICKLFSNLRQNTFSL